MSDRWMSAFSASHAPATRRRNPAASECFCSDAGRSFAALRVGRAENLQRIRAFSSGHFAQWRCRTHGFLGAQHGADLHWRCADVVRVSNRNLCRRNRKIWCAARQNREKLAAISCVVHANFSKILRKFDRWMRAFAALHAPTTRRINSATSECFRSHAGRSVGALRVDRAKNLQ